MAVEKEITTLRDKTEHLMEIRIKTEQADTEMAMAEAMETVTALEQVPEKDQVLVVRLELT